MTEFDLKEAIKKHHKFTNDRVNSLFLNKNFLVKIYYGRNTNHYKKSPTIFH